MDKKSRRSNAGAERTAPSIASRRSIRLLGLLAMIMVADPARAGSFEEAKSTFDRMPLKAKLELQMLLVASGSWPAVSSDQFGRKLFDAIEAYEANTGTDSSRTISPQLFSSLHRTADPLLNLWDMTPINHRLTGTRLWVPNGFQLHEKDTRTGRDIGNDDDTVAISYNFFAGADIAAIHQNLISVPDVTINYHVLRPEFFVVSSSKGSRSSYSRYHAVSGGAIGFTFSWDTAEWVHGERIATLMSDLFRSSVQFGLERTPPSRRSTEVATAPPAPEPPPSAPAALLAFSDVTPSAAAPTIAPPPAPDPQIAEQEWERQRQAKEERFTRLAGDTKRLIDEASSYVKANTDAAHVLDVVQQIADLNGSLTGHDPDLTQKRLLTLSATLQKDPAYAKYEVQRAEDLKRENARYLGDALKAAGAYKAFLVKTVTSNPAAETSGTFLAFVRRIDALVAQPDLERAQALNTEIDLALRQAGLHNDFALSAAPDTTRASGAAMQGAGEAHTAAGVGKSAVQLAATDKNRFLMEGDLGDVVLMYNTGAHAPHVVRNLRGDIVFDGDRADVCVVGAAPDDGMATIVGSALAPYRIKTLIQASTACDAEHLASYDVIAARRATFLKQDMSFSLALAKAIETDGFKKLATLTDAQIKASTAADGVKATEIENDVLRGGRTGFGIVLLKTGSEAVCITPVDLVEGHRRLVSAAGDKLATEIGDSPTPVTTDLDSAFLAIKRAQCGAVYGGAADLKTLVEGLRRDGVSFKFSSVWFSPDDVQTADAAAKAQTALADKQEADRRRAVDEEVRIAAIKAGEAATNREIRQKALREANSPSALAASALISQDVKAFTDRPTEAAGAAQVKFPEFVEAYRATLRDKWELMTQRSELVDYGTADWKGRTLPATLTTVTIRFRNPILGDYRETCTVFGQLQDAEFSTIRDPVATPCDNAQPVSTWRNVHAFRSLWIAD